MPIGEGNPYAPGSLQRVAWAEGYSDKRRTGLRRAYIGVSARVEFAYERGFQGARWHRSPNGQLKWEHRTRG